MLTSYQTSKALSYWLANSDLILTRCVLRLLGGSFRIVRRVDEFLRDGLRVVVVAAGLDRFLIFIHSFCAIAFRIICVAALDARPGINPRRLVIAAVECGLKIIQCQLPVLLFEINEPAWIDTWAR